MSDKPANPVPFKILELFEEGKRFTEDILKENERLRSLVGSLRVERRELEGHGDVPQIHQKLASLEDELRRVRDENQELKGQFGSIEEENRQFAERFVRVERQNSDLINLYVSSYRLHSTLDGHEVLNIVKEIVINMIGAEVFCVYLLDSGTQSLVAIAHESMEEAATKAIPVGEGLVGKTAVSGATYVADGPLTAKAGSEPIACIPLKVGDDVMGVIAIHELLIQKDGFSDVDFELFELLGGHAATAIYTSRLYSTSERKRSTLEGFIDLLRTEPRTEG